MTYVSAASLNGLQIADWTSIPHPVAAGEIARARILVVEGQAVIALDLQRILREGGFRVVGPASNVEEVRRVVARGSLDGAVIDMDSPEEGAAAADLLSEAGIPFVLVTTSRAQVPARHAARKVVEKPYARTELLNAIRSAVDEKAETTGDDILYPVAPPVSFPRILPQL